MLLGSNPYLACFPGRMDQRLNLETACHGVDEDE
jgi:hypothetical protein